MSTQHGSLAVARTSTALRAAATLAAAALAALSACSDAAAPAAPALDALAISAGTLHPAFDPAITEYSAVLPAGTLGVTVTATAASGTLTLAQDAGAPAAVTSGSPSAPLAVPARGARSVVTIVLTIAGVTRTYTVALVQADSADATLSALGLTAGVLDPAFSSGTLAYSVTLPNGTASVKVTPTAGSSTAQSIVVSQDGAAGVQVASGSQSQALTGPAVGGQSVVAIKVTAQDGYTSKTYQLTLTQAGNADATLTSLKPSFGTLAPVFSATTTAYALVVPFGTASVTLTPKANNPAVRSIVLSQDGGAASPVASGTVSAALPVPAAGATSTITLTVTAQDGATTKLYTVAVSQFISTDATLGALTVTAGTLTPAFAAGTTAYAVTVPYGTSSLKFTPTAHDASAKSITVAQDGGAAVAVASGAATAALPAPAVGVTSSVVFTVLAQDQKATQKYTVTVGQAPSTDSALASLAVSAGALVPAFDPAVTSYALTVPSNAGPLTVTPTKRNADAKSITLAQDGGTAAAVASGSASAGLTVPATGSSTTLVLVVTAQSGAATSYTVVVNRAATNDASLSALSVASSPAGATLSPAFAGGTLAYTVTAPFTATTLTLTPTANSPQAQSIKVSLNGGAAATVVSGSPSAALAVPAAGASSTITVTVTAQDGATTGVYTLTLVRHAPDTDATLSALTSSAGTLTPAFSSGTLAYSLAAPFGTASLTVTPVAHAATYKSIAVSQDSGASVPVVSGSPSGLLPVPSFGTSSTVSVIVAAQDGTTTKTYVLTLTQANRNDATLASLTESAGVFTAFAPATLTYSFTVPFQTGAYKVTPTTADALATMTVNGAAATSGQAVTVPLSIGPNTVTIAVTSADGTATKSYVLTITEGGSPPGLVHQRTVPLTAAAPLALASGSFLPLKQAINVPVDTLLRLGFDAAPTLGTTGSIKIFKTSDSSLVDSINLADPYAVYDGSPKKLVSTVTTKANVIGNVSSGIDQVRVVNYIPIFINGSTVTIVPHNNKLAYNTSYYVTIDSGVFSGKVGGFSFGGITTPNDWSFTTKTAQPATLLVAADNSADYATVQGAIDVVPAKNSTSTTIGIAPGVYQELLWVRGKNNVTLQGTSDGLGTVIQYDNCDGFNPGTGAGQAVTTGTIPTTQVAPGGRAVLLVASATGLVLDSITINNFHAQGSAVVPTLPTPSTVATGVTGATFTNYTTSITQAETVYFNTTFAVTSGVGAAGTLVAKHSNFISYQDTLQLKGFSWFYDCFIAGDTDFIWGNANLALFEHSEIKSRFNATAASIVQPRAYAAFGAASTAPTTTTTSYPGFVFLNSALTKEAGAFTAYLARSNGALTAAISGTVYLYGNYDTATFVGCSMDSHIDPQGWNPTPISTNPNAPNTPNVYPNAVAGWREYGSVTPAGAPLDVSHRLVNTVAGNVSDEATWFKDRATIFAGATDGTYTTLGLAGFSPVP